MLTLFYGLVAAVALMGTVANWRDKETVVVVWIAGCCTAGIVWVLSSIG